MSQRVVVGFDGSGEASEALRYAAADVGTDGLIVAVYAETPAQDIGSVITPGMAAPVPVPETQPPAAPAPRDHAVFRALPADTIDGAMLERVVVADRPARALIMVARDRGAEEIVIGTRRHGRIGTALSSVSHDLIHDTDRPVVIVPPPDDG